MDITLTPVTAENRAAAEALRVGADQVTFIETVSECMEEADALSQWHPMGILHSGELIGFTMYGYFVESWGGRLWFDRLLLDRHFQGHGWGKEAIHVILTQMRREFPGEDIYLSVYDDNPHAISLYHFYGFEFNGELDINGEKIMRLPASQPLPQI